jgi:hypothetical protein
MPREIDGYEVDDKTAQAIIKMEPWREPEFFDTLAATGEVIRIRVSGAGDFMARFETIDDDLPHYRLVATPDVCGLCLKDPAEGYAKIGAIRYCHGDNDEITCYQRAGNPSLATDKHPFLEDTTS